ncbi:HdeD family acid-resistance protein [Ferrovibrio xuzhouensis]|uniref:HdeD family acid-resistance protein n=1 Tax=Ferrovibrio xuzhouensis TaxID=1576914 RepID=A0ABV7VHM1_9PROT
MLPSQSSIDTKLSAALQKAMYDHWRLFLAEGIILALLGLGAVIVPPLAGLVSTIFLGWLFLIAGIFGLLFTLRARQAPGVLWSALSAVLALVAGGLLLWNPLQGLVTLTYVLTAFFIADGILTIVLAIAHRRDLSGRWEWMLVNGVIDLILAGIIISGFPGSIAWVLGLLVGIDMMFGGAALIAMALDARKAAP